MKNIILFIVFITCTVARAYAQCDSLAFEIPNNGIDEDCDGMDDLYLHLPPAIYCLEGQDFELYFRNTILSKHPQTYFFEVTTSLSGTNTALKWSFTPTTGAIGSHPFLLTLKNDLGEVLDSKSTIVHVASAAMPADSTQKRLILFGHSFFDQGYLPKHVYDRTHQPNNPAISFHGNKVSWANNQARYEGLGGRDWKYFATHSQSPIRYNGKIDFHQYFESMLGNNLRPDWMIFHLDINDFCGYSPIIAGASLQTIDDSITTIWNNFARPILDSLHAASPHTKIAICYSPPPNGVDTTFNVFNSINPALNNPWRWRRIISRLLFKNSQIYANRENENIWLLPIHLDIDVYNEYPSDDPIHPDYGNGGWNQPHGYTEIAKTMYAWIKHVQHLPTYTYYRDADNDGHGSTTDSLSLYYLPSGYVNTSTDCDDSDPNTHPGAAEICNNGKDDNCNGDIDEDLVPLFITCQDITVPLDANAQATFTEQNIPAEWSDNCGIIADITPFSLHFDCFTVGYDFPQTITVVDTAGNTASCNYSIHIIDTTDTDGDNITNCFDLCPYNGELTAPFPYYIDSDMDGYGSFETFYACAQGQSLSTVANDCDDDDNQVYPNAIEIPDNGIDDNCNNIIDEMSSQVSNISANRHISLMPNPVYDACTIGWETTILPSHLRLYNSTGALVKTMDMPLFQNKNSYGLSLAALPSGIYFIVLFMDDGGFATTQLLKN